jgi:hypothetical protein
MLKSSRTGALPAVLSLSAFFLTSCLIIAGPDKTVERFRERVSARRAFRKGVAFTRYSRYSYVGIGPRQALRDVAAVNAEWISLLVTQRKCYEAALRMVAGRTWLAGMYWWPWMPDPSDGGPDDTGCSPHGKPAEDSLEFGSRKPL